MDVERHRNTDSTSKFTATQGDNIWVDEPFDERSWFVFKMVKSVAWQRAIDLHGDSPDARTKAR